MIGKWELNKVHCVDSYRAIKELPSKSIDCIYTDIPYLHLQGGQSKSNLGQQVLKMHQELKGINNCGGGGTVSICDGIDYSILEEFVRVLKKINCFIWCSKLQILDIMKFFIGQHKCNYELLCWCKVNPIPVINNRWLSDVEYCLYFRASGVRLNNGYELKSKFDISPINVADKEKYLHPTIKPMPIVRRHLLHTTQPNDIVLDAFAGSGTTGVACQDIGRQFIGFEIEQKWAKIANDRLQKIDANGQMGLFVF